MPENSLRGFVDSAPSWDDLLQLLVSRQTPSERGFRSDLLAGLAHNALALLRLFGADEERDVRVKLYRDSAAWCPYCQKVWLLLEEKQISYRVEKVNMRCYGEKPFSYTSKYGQLLPAAEIDGQGITESNDILQHLEQLFPSRPMAPAPDTAAGRRVPALLRLERDLFGAWLQWLRSNRDARGPFEAVMDEVERQLGVGGPPYFLSGCEGAPTADGFGLVDIMFAPFLERMAASLPYFKGYIVRRNPRWPNLAQWFDAVDCRPAYAATKSDFYTHCHDLPPQLGGCCAVPQAAPFQEEVDGANGGWRLPLPATDGRLVEPFELSPNGADPGAACREAAERLISNRVAVARFACRGAGAPGPRPVSAPLADPTAAPAEWLLPAADSALRHVVHVLLTGPTDAVAGAAQWGDAGGPVRASLQYLKDRVGVPRDMSYAAARQLRAHLTWLQDSLRVA